MPSPSGPLSGVQVLDLSSVIVGPACTVRLADFGAAVIKVEPPEGDVMRTLGGPSPTGEHSGSFMHFNRGKRSICLDLKRPEARDILERLLSGADVFVSNMRPSALERLGLCAARLRAVNPRLIHCTISGFGPDGPYRGLPAYDSVVQGASGLAALFQRRDGQPIYVPLLICDHVVGEIAAGAIMAALVERARTGLGSTVEVPMFETMAAFVLQEHLGPQSFDPPLGPVGDTRILSHWNRPVQTVDGWLSLTTNSDAQVVAFLRAVGRPELIEDERFCSNAARFRNADAWFAFRGGALKAKSTAEWITIFREADVPAMPCHSLETILSDPHLAAVGLVHEAEHPTEGRVRGLRSTVLTDGRALPPATPAAPKGWDTRSVLSDAGFSDGEIRRFLATGAAQEHESGEPGTGEPRRVAS